MRSLPALLIIALLAAPAFALDAPSRKIVLIAGPITGHPKHTHEYEKSVILLKHLLDTSNLTGVRIEAHFGGWPKDESTLDDADTIVLISDGGDRNEPDHPLYVGKRRETLAKQMKRGCGFVQYHWTTFHPSRFHEETTEWAGGYFDYQSGSAPNKWFSAISTWTGPVKLGPAGHPVLRGVKPFELEEEFYWRIKFRDNDTRVTPIVIARPPGQKEDFPVGWAVERADGGRGFGFTGGHFYKNWWLPDYRKLILNAIAWTAKAEIPAGGVESKLDDPRRVLILTGHNHPAHDWRKTTAVLIPVLEQDPRLIVDVTENMEDLAAESLSKYDLLVQNYSSWDKGGLSEAAKKGLLDWLKTKGGGLSVIHFANGAFTDTLPNKTSDWPEYRTKIVRRVWVHGDGRSGHDPFGPFHVELTAVKHPITAGLKPFDTVDELYFKQEGDLPIEPLVSGVSKVTGKDEPLAWAYTYEKTRVFQTLLGHADVSIVKAGALIRRGSVWAAGLEPLTFDPPSELCATHLFRAGSQWTLEDSLKRGGVAPAPSSNAANEPVVVPGKFGQGLNTRSGGVLIEGDKVFRQAPFTVELWAKVRNPKGYNILVANELKNSGTHWEIFSEAGNGGFTVYTPGLSPDHLRTGVNLCDDAWHYLAFVYEPERIRLYVDGKPAGEQAVKPLGKETVAGGLAIGSLVGQELRCDGVIDEVRITSGVKDVSTVPAAPFRTEEATIGHWRFDELGADKSFADSSTRKAKAFHVTSEAGKKKVTAVPAGNAEDHFGETAVGFKWTEVDSRDDRWQQAEIGPVFSGTIAHADGPTLKGLVIRVGEKGEGTVCYDTDLLRMSAAWTGGFLQFNPARFGLISPPAAKGEIRFTAPALPGWSPARGLKDPRPRPFGPLPRDWAHYRGHYRHGPRSVLEYTVGDVLVRETPWLETNGGRALITRQFEIAAAKQPLELMLGKARVVVSDGPVSLRDENGNAIATIAPHEAVVRIKLALDDTARMEKSSLAPADDLSKLMAPGPALWTRPIVTRGVVAGNPSRKTLGTDRIVHPTEAAASPYVLDTLTVPFDNPYKALMFCSGHDFFSNGDAAVCTVHGDVWRVSGIDDTLQRLTWKRFATGLFQPLGLKVIRDQVYVLGRDQLTRLHDRDGNGEADFYENVNNDGQITANAHEFAACLETDRAGNFYYLRGDSGSQTEHDGCLLRVTPDGKSLDVFATGFRNGNGLSIGPGDAITVAPQEGNWTPASAIFQVRQGGFYGAMQSHHRKTPPSDYEKPLCWIPRLEDNSSGGQVWVERDRWGPLRGELLHFSFGTCKMFLVVRDPADRDAAPKAAGTVAFPLDFASGVMRGRFRPQDGQLYVTGLKGWVSRAVQDGCFQRVRYTGAPVDMPVKAEPLRNGLAITYTRPLDKAEAENPDNYNVQQWNYRWSADYGSPEFKVSQPLQTGRDEVDVASATLLDDRTVFLEIPGLQPVMQMGVGTTLKSADGRPIQQTLNLTINAVGSASIPDNRLVRRPRPGQLPEETRTALRPGLTLEFLQNGSVIDARRERMAALHVPAKEPASPLVLRQFTADFTGYLHVTLKGNYRFALAGRGTAELEVNGETVATLTGEADSPELRRFTADERPVALHRGYNAVRLVYRPPQSGDASLRAFWAGDGFAIEPLPPTALFSDGRDETLAGSERWRLGRDVLESHRCFRCHASTPARGALARSEAEGPRLTGLGARVGRGWLVQWLESPRTVRNDARMPEMFDPKDPVDRKAVRDIAAWLTRDPPPAQPAEQPAELQERGRILYETLGCIGCHRLTPPSEDDEFHRHSLAAVGQKFPAGSLEQFLQDPHADYPASRMPNFRLTDDESRALAAALRASSSATVPESEPGDPKRGAAEFTARGCRACHVADESPATVLGLSPLARLDHGCLSEADERRGRAPRFTLSDSERTAVREHLRRDSAGETRVPLDDSRRLFQELRCGVCHPRDGQPAILPIAQAEDGILGISPEQFPNLTWTGERLRPEWTERFLAGKEPEKPRPWLRGRMPSFPSASRTLARGLSLEHGLPAEPVVLPEPRPELAKVGAQLVEKTGGLDCRQCHAIGDRPASGDQATQIALGINFALTRQRLRPEFYTRFVLDPPRFDPGTRMPILIPDGRRTPATRIFDGDAHRQLEAIWEFVQSQ